jgi:malonyl-CoA/methylmalonyl-CoA synthetase
LHLFHLLDHSLLGRAREVALEWQGALYTFGDLERRSNRVARWLGAQGIVSGDRVGVYLANRIEMIDLYLAVLKLGAIFVPVNILYRERELAHILQDAEPKLFLAAEDVNSEWESFDASRPPLPEDLGGDSPACLVYTSGTTGASKGAILTHNNFAANAMNICAAWNLSAADRLLLALPLFHVHGLGNGLHAWLLTGMRMRLLERFESKATELEFQDFQPSVFFGVPTMYVRMLEWESHAAARLFVSGSAPLAPQLLEAFRVKFGQTILERYGMTETLMIASNPYHGERRAGSVGPALPGISLRQDGESGEILVKGPNVCAGYWRRPEATEAAFSGGWFRTGDVGRIGADGYVTLEGRKSDLIISGGFNVYPREIEEFLLEQPEIAEAAVAGAADAAKGEVPVAFVVRRPGADWDAEAMRGRCASALASFKVPRAFVLVEKLPRNALGKVQKHLLAR